MSTISMENTFGALEIGSSVSVFLFGIVTLQMHLYYSTFHNDRMLFKSLVAIVWVLELSHTSVTLYEVYRTTILLIGVPRMEIRHPALGVVVMIGTYISTITQLFSCYRLWSIVPKPYNHIGPITALLTFARCSIVTYAGIKEIIAPVYMEYMAEMRPWLMALLALTMAIDIIIAVSLTRFFLVKRDKTLTKTTRLIDQLIGFTLRTGLITSITAMVVLILYCTMSENLIFFAVYNSLSKLYTNAFLSGLNARISLRDTLSNSVSLEVIKKGDRRVAPTDNVSLTKYNNNQGAISIEMKTTTDFRSDSLFGVAA